MGRRRRAGSALLGTAATSVVAVAVWVDNLRGTLPHCLANLAIKSMGCDDYCVVAPHGFQLQVISLLPPPPTITDKTDRAEAQKGEATRFGSSPTSFEEVGVSRPGLGLIAAAKL